MQLTSDSVITFHCPKCNAKLRIPTKLTGIEGPCPSCKTKIKAPLSDQNSSPDQDDSSLDNDRPNEIIRKKVSPQKKHTTASTNESLEDIFSENRSTEVDLNPIPKPYRQNNKKTANKIIFAASISIIILSSIFAYKVWTGSEQEINQKEISSNIAAPIEPEIISDVTSPQDAKAENTGTDPVNTESAVTPVIQLDAAHLTLEKFLKASNLNDRTRHILNSDKLLPQIIEYYKENPIPIEEAEILSNTSNAALSSGDSYFRIFQVTTKQQKEPFPVYLENTESGWKVSWSSFIQFNENALGKFLKNYQSEERAFYTKLERAHFFGSGVPQIGSKICFKIQPPIQGDEEFVFAARDSKIAKFSDKEFEWGEEYFPIVRLKWIKTEDGHQFIEITEIEQKTWRSGQSQPSTVTST
ncbi:MAG: hypothetical protein QF426_08630 [Verrucomicrobiales bacterium]|nr:hypothetical protein [Verrucomicrobiales bacterium]